MQLGKNAQGGVIECHKLSVTEVGRRSPVELGDAQHTSALRDAAERTARLAAERGARRYVAGLRSAPPAPAPPSPAPPRVATTRRREPNGAEPSTTPHH